MLLKFTVCMIDGNKDTKSITIYICWCKSSVNCNVYFDILNGFRICQSWLKWLNFKIHHFQIPHFVKKKYHLTVFVGANMTIFDCKIICVFLKLTGIYNWASEELYDEVWLFLRFHCPDRVYH